MSHVTKSFLTVLYELFHWVLFSFVPAAIWEVSGDVEAPFYYVAATCAVGSLITCIWYIYHKILPGRRQPPIDNAQNQINDVAVL